MRSTVDGVIVTSALDRHVASVTVIVETYPSRFHWIHWQEKNRVPVKRNMRLTFNIVMVRIPLPFSSNTTRTTSALFDHSHQVNKFPSQLSKQRVHLN